MHSLPWSGSDLNTDDLGTKFDDFVPFALFNLLPLLGALIVLAIGALSAKGGRPSITSPFLFGFLGVSMIFVGMLGGVLYPIGDLGLQGTVFEEGVLVYVVYGGGARDHGRHRVLGAEALGPDGPGQARDAAGRSRARRDGARVVAVLHRPVSPINPPPPRRYDYGGPAELWNALVLVGHGLMLLTVLGLRRARRQGGPHRRMPTMGRATIRGTRRRSSGPPPRRRRSTTSPRCP